jgi:signal transduction histidine kinase
VPNLPPSQRLRAQQIIERQVRHMTRLVEDLLEVSRITRGVLQLRKERITLGSVLEAAAETARPWVEGSQHTLQLGLPEEPVWLVGDPVRLAQVFANLLTNAAKYTPPGGRIEVEARPAAHEVQVIVRDTGVGIESGELERVFDLFAQTGVRIERGDGGLGIGLALVRGLVGLHGGTVVARSEGVGKGAEFVVRLPTGVEADTSRAEALQQALDLTAPAGR